MNIQLSKEILAVVALDANKVQGGAPIFLAADKNEMATVALLIAQVLNGAVHDLQNEVYIVVRH